MKVIFIAGKYLGVNHSDTYMHIDVARREAEFVWSRGAIAVCPHLNSSWMGGVCDEQYFYDGYLELVKRCDAVYTCWNWRDSKGAPEEVKLAISIGIPVLHDRGSLMDWLKDV